jgi:hypothetical protein
MANLVSSGLKKTLIALTSQIKAPEQRLESTHSGVTPEEALVRLHAVLTVKCRDRNYSRFGANGTVGCMRTIAGRGGSLFSEGGYVHKRSKGGDVAEVGLMSSQNVHCL